MMYLRKTQTKPRANYPYFSFKDLFYFLTASKFDLQWPRVGNKNSNFMPNQQNQQHFSNHFGSSHC